MKQYGEQLELDFDSADETAEVETIALLLALAGEWRCECGGILAWAVQGPGSKKVPFVIRGAGHRLKKATSEIDAARVALEAVKAGDNKCTCEVAA